MRVLLGLLIFAAAIAVLLIMTDLGASLWRALRAWLRSSAENRSDGGAES